MKKLIAISIVLTVLASAAFAQDSGLSFAGWGRGVFAPIRVVDPDPGDSTTYAGVGKWSAYPRVGFTLKGDWEKVGAQGDINFNEAGDNNIDVGDFAYIWAKPWDFLKFSVGKFNDDTLRGKIGDTNWSGDVTLGMSAEDDLFTRFQGNGLGAEVALTPIEGLYIAAEVNAGEFPGNTIKAARVYEKIQVGAGYQIPDIGHARVQFKGGNGILDTTTALADIMEGKLPTQDNGSRVEIAFALSAVENLTLDLGAKIWFAANKYEDPANGEIKKYDDYSYTNPVGISLAGNYTLDDFGILARFDTKIGAKYEGKETGADIVGKSGFYLNAHLVPSYNLGFATIGADIGFQLNPEITYEYGSTSGTLDEGGVGFGLGAWIQKDLGNGLIKTGVGVTLPTTSHKIKVPGTTVTTETKDPLVLTIPVIVEYWF